jgi:hypothetical protein
MSAGDYGQGAASGEASNVTRRPWRSIRTGSRPEESTADTRTITLRAPVPGRPGVAAATCTGTDHERRRASIQLSPVTRVSPALQDALPKPSTSPEPGPSLLPDGWKLTSALSKLRVTVCAPAGTEMRHWSDTSPADGTSIETDRWPLPSDSHAAEPVRPELFVRQSAGSIATPAAAAASIIMAGANIISIVWWRELARTKPRAVTETRTDE